MKLCHAGVLLAVMMGKCNACDCDKTKYVTSGVASVGLTGGVIAMACLPPKTADGINILGIDNTLATDLAKLTTPIQTPMELDQVLSISKPKSAVNIELGEYPDFMEPHVERYLRAVHDSNVEGPFDSNQATLGGFIEHRWKEMAINFNSNWRNGEKIESDYLEKTEEAITRMTKYFGDDGQIDDFIKTENIRDGAIFYVISLIVLSVLLLCSSVYFIGRTFEKCGCNCFTCSYHREAAGPESSALDNIA